MEVLGFDSRFLNGIYPAGRPFKYVVIKATEGTGFKTENYEIQRDAAKASGLFWAPYHFYRNWLGPEDQAAYFRPEVGSDAGQLPPVLDLEDTSASKLGETPGRALPGVKGIERMFGRKPNIYSAS